MYELKSSVRYSSTVYPSIGKILNNNERIIQERKQIIVILTINSSRCVSEDINPAPKNSPKKQPKTLTVTDVQTQIRGASQTQTGNNGLPVCVVENEDKGTIPICISNISGG